MNKDINLQYLQHIEQLKAELTKAQQRLSAQQKYIAKQRQQQVTQRRAIAQKYGPEVLALLDDNPIVKSRVIDNNDRLIFFARLGNMISKTDDILISKIIEIQVIESL